MFYKKTNFNSIFGFGFYLCIDSTSGEGPRPSDLDFPVREGGSLTPVPVLIGALKYEYYIKYNVCIR